MSAKVNKLNLSVIIDEDVYEKIMHWCNKASPKEVSGLGNVIYDKELKALRVTDAWLLEQENTSSTTDIDENSIGKLEYKHHLMKKKGEIEGELKFWWHSHVNMGVFWSGTDMDTIEQLGSGGWFLSTVFNLKEEMKSAVYQTDPMEFFADDLDTLIDTSISDNDIEEILEVNGFRAKDLELIRESVGISISDKTKEGWDKEFDENVKVKTFTPTVHRSNFGNGHFSNGKWTSYNSDIEDIPTSIPKKDDGDLKNVKIAGTNLIGTYNPHDIIEDIYYSLMAFPSMTDVELAEDLGYEYPGVDLIQFIRLNRAKAEIT